MQHGCTALSENPADPLITHNITFTVAICLTQYKMSASFLEIYNETLRDLLTTSSSGSSTSHEIKIDPERPGHVYVTNLTPVPVTSEKQVGTV